MSISTAAKIGGAALASGGVPTASFVVYDSFFSLYKAESDVLDPDTILKVEKDTTQTSTDSKIIYLKIHKESTWECIIKAEATEDNPVLSSSESDLIKLLKDKLPTEETDKSNIDTDNTKKLKQVNKKNLVKNCSKNRKSSEEQSNDKVVSEITVSLKKSSAETTNNKWTFEDENLGKLFGKGFWI